MALATLFVATYDPDQSRQRNKYPHGNPTCRNCIFQMFDCQPHMWVVK